MRAEHVKSCTAAVEPRSFICFHTPTAKNESYLREHSRNSSRFEIDPFYWLNLVHNPAEQNKHVRFLIEIDRALDSVCFYKFKLSQEYC